MDEIAHKVHLVGFVRSFGIYAKPFFESGQKFGNLKQIKAEIIGQVRMRVHRGDTTLRRCAMKAWIWLARNTSADDR